MIRLEPSLLIARGGHRSCYLHPDDRHKCIKVLHESWKDINRRKNDPFRVLRRKRHYDENLTEQHEIQLLQKKLGPKFSRHFPQCYDFIETNEGPGLVTELIKDVDGTISPTLTSYLKKSGMNADCRAQSTNSGIFCWMNKSWCAIHSPETY
jgi:hypothetical protein